MCEMHAHIKLSASLSLIHIHCDVTKVKLIETETKILRKYTLTKQDVWQAIWQKHKI